MAGALSNEKLFPAVLSDASKTFKPKSAGQLVFNLKEIMASVQHTVIMAPTQRIDEKF